MQLQADVNSPQNSTSSDVDFSNETDPFLNNDNNSNSMPSPSAPNLNNSTSDDNSTVSVHSTEV